MSKPKADDAAGANEQMEQEAQVESEVKNVTDSAEENVTEMPGEVQELTLEQALERLADAEEEAEKAKGDLLRVQAEMQNLRRRTEQDIEKAHKYGQEKFSTELLSVMDNLERALDAASQHDDEVVKAIYEGVDLPLKSFNDCFSKFAIESVDPLGEPFDPQLHQAMSMQDAPDAEPNTIISVMQKGYTLHGRVIRPAMVMVAKGKEPTPKIDGEV